MKDMQIMKLKKKAALSGLVAALAAAGLLTLPRGAMAQAPAALPQEHVVHAGRVRVETAGTTMTIDQTSMAAKLDWRSFDIARDHAVRIKQPGPDAFIVNRITGPDPSRIDGALSADGRVYLVNPNGILFGPESKVDVGSLFAAGSRLGDAAMKGERVPAQLGTRAAQVTHAGLIMVRDGGVASLQGSRVEMKTGSSIEAFGATVKIAADESATLGRLNTHSLEIDVPWRVKVQPGSNSQEGGSGAPLALEASGLHFTADSTLGLDPPSRPPMAGTWETWWDLLRVDFKDWLGDVTTKQQAVVDTRSVKDAPGQSAGASGHSVPDLPVLDKELIGGIKVRRSGDRTMTVTQKAHYAVLDWKSFNVGEDHRVIFQRTGNRGEVLPGSGWIAVNRIADTQGSRIHGRLDAAGTVFLFNPNGLLLGRTARVQVGGGAFLAFSLSDEQAKQPTVPWDLSNPLSKAEVRNEGSIKVAKGGIATLGSPFSLVQNGLINAPSGTVNLANTALATIGANGHVIGVHPTLEGGRLVHRGRTLVHRGRAIVHGVGNDLELSGLVDTTAGQLEVFARRDGLLNGQIRPGSTISIRGHFWHIPKDPAARGPRQIAARSIASWLDAGSDVVIEPRGAIEGAIHATGVPGSRLTLDARHADAGKTPDIELKADIRLREGDIRLRSGGGAIRMDAGTTLATDKGMVAFDAAGGLVLGSVKASKIEIKAPLVLGFEAMDKAGDGTTRAEVRNETFSGLDLLEGSNLKLRKTYRFDSPQYGERAVTPSVSLTGFNGDAELPLTPELSPSTRDIATIAHLPVLDKVVGGGAAPEVSGKTMTIRQSSDLMLLDWKSFEVGEGHQVRFIQSQPNWWAINRVAETAGTKIAGAVHADESVMFLSPGGADIHRGATVTARRFVMTRMTADDPDPLAWRSTLRLSGERSKPMTHLGTVQVKERGAVILAATGTLQVDGTIEAPLGDVHLATTEQARIDREGRFAANRRRDGLILHDEHARTIAPDGTVAFWGSSTGRLNGTVEADGTGEVHVHGTGAHWDLRGEIKPGAKIRLVHAVDRLEEPEGDGAISAARISEWLKAGVDVQIEKPDGTFLTIKPEPEPEPEAESGPAPMPEEKPAPEPAPVPEEKPAPEPTPMPEEKPAPEPTPVPEEKPAPEPAPEPVLKPDAAPDSDADPKPEPGPGPGPEPVLKPDGTLAPDPADAARPIESERQPAIEPQTRPDIRPDIAPDITPAKPRQRALAPKAGERLACEERRGMAPQDRCDRSPMPVPEAHRPALSDRGLRLPEDAPRPPR